MVGSVGVAQAPLRRPTTRRVTKTTSPTSGDLSETENFEKIKNPKMENDFFFFGFEKKSERQVWLFPNDEQDDHHKKIGSETSMNPTISNVQQYAFDFAGCAITTRCIVDRSMGIAAIALSNKNKINRKHDK